MFLLSQLKDFRKKDKISFHVPGHRFGRGLSREFKRRAFEIDVTEFEETDNLQDPEGILAEAQRRASSAFGAGYTFYLTNGSSIGLHGAICGACRRGDTLIVDRCCHKAVISAIVLGGIRPVFINQDFDEESGLYMGMNPDTVRDALHKNPDAVGMVLTSPTYYGVCSDIEEIAKMLHRSNKFLIVDEAHGAHFVFHPKLPWTALELGADIVIQSIHKTLPAPGQTSVLHISRDSMIKFREIERALRLFQTTSPSYMLMASVDEAVIHMQRKGRAELSKRIEEIRELKRAVEGRGVISFFNGKACDTLRLVADVRKTGKSGAEISKILKTKYGIYAEMTDLYHVVFVVTCANTKSDIRTLKKALIKISHMYRDMNKNDDKIKPLPNVEIAVLPSEAWQRECEKVLLSEANGRISGEICAACPPGAATLVPGQIIKKEDINYILFDEEDRYISVLI